MNGSEMVWEQDVVVEGICCRVVVSDEAEALLAAKAAGRVVVGCLGEDGGRQLPMAHYLVETMDAADGQYLERVVRRERGLPWRIAEGKRLRLREFTVEDAVKVPEEPGDREADRVFYEEDRLAAYIQGQYRFLEYGLWAVERKEDGVILGKAGLAGCDGDGYFELAYHIFRPWRRKGYAEEACRMVLGYVQEEYGEAAKGVYAVVEASNYASAGLLQKLGFSLTEPGCNGARHRYCLCGPYC
ncbi:N-acetyltransferase [Clostridiaceae bacterium]|nr:N-acetyltransferase [Clostridiaceae bacterium]RKI12210.1 N-acetyltransferase [bacterium 1XD21-70]